VIHDGLQNLAVCRGALGKVSKLANIVHQSSLFRIPSKLHTKLAIPYSQAIRYRRNISEEDELRSALETLKNKFYERAYPTDIVNKQIDKVLHIPREHTLTYKTKEDKEQRRTKFSDKDILIPFIITYHPNFLRPNSESIHKYIQRSWTEFLLNNKELETIFNNTTVRTVFKKGQSLSQLLTSSTYPATAERTS